MSCWSKTTRSSPRSPAPTWEPATTVSTTQPTDWSPCTLSRFAFRRAKEFRHEDCRHDIDGRRTRASPAAQQVVAAQARQMDRRAGDETDAYAVGDREAQRDAYRGRNTRNRIARILPIKVHERTHHQAGHEQQRGAGRVRRDARSEWREPQADQKQHRDHDGRQPCSPTALHARRTLDVARCRLRPHNAAEHGRG